MNPVKRASIAIAEIRRGCTENFGFSDAEVASIMGDIYSRGDRYMSLFLTCHAVTAIFLAFFYQTWALTLPVTILAIGLFQISVRLLPGAFLTRCVAGISIQMFVALHIYQLHGLPEMHFFFFTAFTMMMVYQDWICMWPGALLIIGQHILFAILHNTGNAPVFFPEGYIGFTKLFFHFGIAIVHVIVCGSWAILKRRQTLRFHRQESDLREATLKAEDAARAKSAFLAAMSHEIRTPLNAVVGMTQLLLDTPLNPKQRQFADSVRKGADSLLGVINDVLDFSKIEARKLTIHPAPMDLKSTLEEVVDLLRFSAAQKDLQLFLVYPDHAPVHFSADAIRIRQIALNFLSNAVKYTEFGSITVRVEVNTSTPLASVRIAVEDTGVGIPANLQPFVFQEFRQLDSEITRRQGGTGLGLAITRNLVELMDGEIGFSSTPGTGSTFWASIPMLVVEHHKTLPAPCPDSTSRKFSSRVLVAEDNLVNQTIIEAFLKKFDCSVTIASDGKEAVSLCQSRQFDLIFMDCQMPKLDGYSATREIRSLETQASRTPIVAMTAYAMSGDREACLSAGMDDYLTKPLSLAALAAVLERWSPHSSPSSASSACSHAGSTTSAIPSQTIPLALPPAPPTTPA